jgi:hypothetical protein
MYLGLRVGEQRRHQDPEKERNSFSLDWHSNGLNRSYVGVLLYVARKQFLTKQWIEP